MSRTQAAGKTRWIKDVPTAISQGKVNRDQVKADIEAKGIELRGGAPDEAPEIYKSLDEVLSQRSGTIKVLHRLHPIGVAMAGQDIIDPYKD